MALLKDDVCDTTYAALSSSGARSADAITTIVVHSTEGDTAESAAAGFANAAQQHDHPGSAQLIVDDTICYRTLDDLTVACGAPGVNRRALHIENSGWASWDRRTWIYDHSDTIERCAYHIAQWCGTYNIPAVELNCADLARGNRGIVRHSTVSDTYRLSDHTDPGDGYPMDELLSRVLQYLPGSSAGYYRTVAGDTWESVAATLGVSVDDLHAANPEVDELVEGVVLDVLPQLIA